MMKYYWAGVIMASIGAYIAVSIAPLILHTKTVHTEMICILPEKS